MDEKIPFVTRGLRIVCDASVLFRKGEICCGKQSTKALKRDCTEKRSSTGHVFGTLRIR
jgi:hypothetical protein